MGDAQLSNTAPGTAVTQFDSAELRPDEPADHTAGRARGATHLVVNEIFGPTIQGDGLSAGVPAIFLRAGWLPPVVHVVRYRSRVTLGTIQSQR